MVERDNCLPGPEPVKRRWQRTHGTQSRRASNPRGDAEGQAVNTLLASAVQPRLASLLAFIVKMASVPIEDDCFRNLNEGGWSGERLQSAWTK